MLAGRVGKGMPHRHVHVIRLAGWLGASVHGCCMVPRLWWLSCRMVVRALYLPCPCTCQQTAAAAGHAAASIFSMAPAVPCPHTPGSHHPPHAPSHVQPRQDCVAMGGAARQ